VNDAGRCLFGAAREIEKVAIPIMKQKPAEQQVQQDVDDRVRA
jgi:hypothetical protein